VRRPLIALVLALVVGASPVIGAICALDCDGPITANTKSTCHGTPAPSGNQKLRAVAHTCGHHHNGVVAIVRGSSAREVGMSSADLATMSLISPVLGLQSTPVSMTHGPPGSIGRKASSLNTVLRI
jgi:hypothetical protein